MDIIAILKHALEVGASDVHIVADSAVMMRLEGEMVPVRNVPIFDLKTATSMIYQILTDPQRAQFEKEWSVDATISVNNVRFRVNVTLQRQGVEAVFRVLHNGIPSPEDLMVPPSVIKLTELKRGLVLFTGPTGTGKSTTLASLVDRINQTRRAKIITLEDPIEYIHVSKNSFISQREVGLHTPSFEHSMREILRQDPDVVLLGEMRDYETISSALMVADTGHLVLATMHSQDAPQAVERIIDFYPGHQQHQIRAQLAAILKAVVGQTLLPRLDGNGRVAAFEVMMITPAIASLIRQGRTHEIYNAIEMGSGEGMRSLTRALHDLVKQGLIDPSLAQPAPPPPSGRPIPPHLEGPDRRRSV